MCAAGEDANQAIQLRTWSSIHHHESGGKESSSTMEWVVCCSLAIGSRFSSPPTPPHLDFVPFQAFQPYYPVPYPSRPGGSLPLLPVYTLTPPSPFYLLLVPSIIKTAERVVTSSSQPRGTSLRRRRGIATFFRGGGELFFAGDSRFRPFPWRMVHT